MARRRSSVTSTRSVLYGPAWLLGDVQAVSKAPQAMANNAARRGNRKALSRTLEKPFK